MDKGYIMTAYGHMRKPGFNMKVARKGKTLIFVDQPRGTYTDDEIDDMLTSRDNVVEESKEDAKRQNGSGGGGDDQSGRDEDADVDDDEGSGFGRFFWKKSGKLLLCSSSLLGAADMLSRKVFPKSMKVNLSKLIPDDMTSGKIFYQYGAHVDIEEHCTDTAASSSSNVRCHDVGENFPRRRVTGKNYEMSPVTSGKTKASLKWVPTGRMFTLVESKYSSSLSQDTTTKILPNRQIPRIAILVDVPCPKLSLRYANARESLFKCMVNSDIHPLICMTLVLRELFGMKSFHLGSSTI
ncbi:hypothetical protein Tco_0615018 [Tanacetum coccineum]